MDYVFDVDDSSELKLIVPNIGRVEIAKHVTIRRIFRDEIRTITCNYWKKKKKKSLKHLQLVINLMKELKFNFPSHLYRIIENKEGIVSATYACPEDDWLNVKQRIKQTKITLFNSHFNSYDINSLLSVRFIPIIHTEVFLWIARNDDLEIQIKLDGRYRWFSLDINISNERYGNILKAYLLEYFYTLIQERFDCEFRNRKILIKCELTPKINIAIHINNRLQGLLPI